MMKHLKMFAFLMLTVSATTVSAADVAAGKAKAVMCAGCHGANGISALPQNPNLAGQKEVYLVNALNAYKAQARKDATMNAMAAPLTDADIANLAAYFSGLKP